MKSPEDYCPQCVEPLVPDTKKLGKISKWWVCPNCGHRARKTPVSIDTVGHSLDRIKNRNKNLNKFNTNTEGEY